MANPGPYPHGEADSDGENDPGARLGRRPTRGMPPWVGVLAVVLGIALVVLLLILHLNGTIGGGVHR
jgi:hypothetical protein